MFFLFPLHPLLGKHILSSQSCNLSIPTTASLKNWSKTYKKYSENLLQRFTSTPIAKDPEPKNGIKMQQKLLSGFLLPLVIYLSGFDLFNVLFFLNFYDDQLGHFVLSISLKELY